eukprot:1581150-Amphidinium_carterae.1
MHEVTLTPPEPSSSHRAQRLERNFKRKLQSIRTQLLSNQKSLKRLLSNLLRLACGVVNVLNGVGAPISECRAG